MSERYIKLFSLDAQAAAPGSDVPAQVEAGALLKDSKSLMVIAQIKFRNISTKSIKEMSVAIKTQDGNGKAMKGTLGYQYRNLLAGPGDFFGDRVAIPLTDNNAHSFSVEITKVIFSDGSSWSKTIEQTVETAKNVGNETAKAVKEAVNIFKKPSKEMIGKLLLAGNCIFFLLIIFAIGRCIGRGIEGFADIVLIAALALILLISVPRIDKVIFKKSGYGLFQRYLRWGSALAIFLIAQIIISSAFLAGTSDKTAESTETEVEAEEDAKDKSKKDTKEDSKEETKDALDEIVFKETVVVNNKDCRIAITGIEPDDVWGYTLKTTFENKSKDKSYMFSVASSAINQVQVDPFFATEVAAKKKANEDISFTADDTLKKNGIEKFTDIELTFRVTDANNFMEDAIVEETVHIYPYGEEHAAGYHRESSETDMVIVENDQLTAIVTGYEENGVWGYTVNLYLENKTSNEVMFSVQEASVNGTMEDPFFAKSVLPGKCAFTSMSWSDTMLEDDGITSVEEIEFLLRAYDANDYFADDILNEKVLLKIK